MKLNLSLLLAVSILFTACIEEGDSGSQTAPNAADETTEIVTNNEDASFTDIEWIDSIKNMGAIKEGQKLEIVFRFKNSGNKPLVIQSATPSCGCTVPERPNEPIMPGKEGFIKAQFDSEGRPGANHKSITVMANTTGTQSHILEFNVEVKGKSQSQGDPTSNFGS